MIKNEAIKKNIEFNAEGVTLRGWLFNPANSSGPLPAIVMTHGYNCIKELYLDKYAEIFCDMGFVVLAYDNRNFGDSDGEPRQELDPWQQIKDYRHAITFLQTQSFVDPERIGIWGTSYSGGHVLVVAAIRLGASAVQMGTAFLTCTESGIHPSYKSALLNTAHDNTTLTLHFLVNWLVAICLKQN